MSPEPLFPGIGVHSGQVMTVLGPIPADELGVTLTHEHILSDIGCVSPEPEEASRKHLFNRPITMEILGELRVHPHYNRDDQRLTDLDVMTAEVAQFAYEGGGSIVEVTLEGFGRDVTGLQQISRRTGVHIIASAGYYIEASHPARLRSMSIDDIADEIVRDLVEGVPGTGIRAGSIGEVGIDVDFTPAEEKGLRAACRASARTQVPLTIHTPGGSAKSHEYRRRILDIVEEEGADVRHTILEHVYIRPADFGSQLEFAARGAFLGYDGVSCNFEWGFRGSGPCDHELAADIKRLIDAGFLHHILLSHDVHQKIMLTAYGGTGYGHILRHFLPRLREYGVADEQIRVMLVDNPRRYFSSR